MGQCWSFNFACDLKKKETLWSAVSECLCQGKSKIPRSNGKESSFWSHCTKPPRGAATAAAETPSDSNNMCHEDPI